MNVRTEPKLPTWASGWLYEPDEPGDPGTAMCDIGEDVHVEDGGATRSDDDLGIYSWLLAGPRSDGVIHDTAQARSLARQLLQAADVLDHIRGVIPRGGKPTPIANDLLAEAIRTRMREVALTQGQLAVAVGYGPEELGQRLNGLYWFDASDVDRIARALGIDAHDLLARAAGA